MRYRILDKKEVWAKIHEGRTVYVVDIGDRRICSVIKLRIDIVDEYLRDDKAIFIEDIAPDYDNEDGE